MGNIDSEEDLSPARSFIFPQQKRSLVYPASLRPAKGQLDFLNLLFTIAPDSHEGEQLSGLHIYFAGGCMGNTSYCSHLVQRCQQLIGKQVFQCTFLGPITKRELALVYRNVDGTILY